MASRHRPSSSTSTTSSLPIPVYPVWSLPPSSGRDRRLPVFPVWAFWSDDNTRRVPGYRGLIQSEECLEHLVPGQLPQLRKELEWLNSEGRAALEDGDWERAESSFLTCKSQLRSATESLEKQVFGFLLAWVDTPLAQLYQFPDTADTMDFRLRIDLLRKATSLREEMLDCILPLGNADMIKACQTYLCTALYELGELTGSPDVQSGVVQQYPDDIAIEEAEAHICVLLWCDHYFSGNLEVSLRWIRKANRLWKGNAQNRVYILIEAGLCIKLKMFLEAIIVLEGLNTHVSHDHHAIRRLVRLCYIRMSKTAESDVDSDQADLYKALALSLSDVASGADENEKKLVDSHPLMRGLPHAVGSCLGLAQDKSLAFFPFAHDALMGLMEADMGILTTRAHFCMSEHLPKLPTLIQSILGMYGSKAKDAHVRREWEDVIWYYQMFRTFLKISKRTVDSKTYTWLLAWVDVELADLYQYHVGELEKAVELWKELKYCAKQLMPSEEDSIFWGYSLNLDLAEFECKQASGSGEHVDIIQRRARCPHYAPFELYFWLYLHHHIRGNFESSLRWLQEAKKLKEQVADQEYCPLSSPENYFCCEYTLLRYEADLWMKLQATEEAIRSVKDMLTSRQCHAHQGSQKLAREGKQWLRKLRGKCEARPSAVEDDEHEQEGILDDSPSATGCSCLFDGVYGRENSQQEVIQSTTGLEHHLHKLPVPIQVAFRAHSDQGHSSMKFADWEAAIFNYEWCKELLRLTMRIHKFESKTYDWLLVWLDVPLVEVYEFRKMDFRRVLELRSEMLSKVPADLPDIRNILAHLRLVALYQCAVSYYPEVKNEVLKIISEAFNVDTYSSAEDSCLSLLHRRNFMYGNLGSSWRYLDHRQLALTDDEKWEDLQQRPWILEMRIWTLWKLSRIREAQALIQEFQRRTDKRKVDLPRSFQYLLTVNQSQDPHVLDQYMLTDDHKLDQDNLDALRLRPNSKLRLEVEELRQEARELWNNNEWDKAVECYERFLENSTMVQPQPFLLNYLKIHDYLTVGTMHLHIWCKKGNRYGETIQDFQEDYNFSRAVLYLEKCNELPSHQRDITQVAYANCTLVGLYARVDDILYLRLGDLTAASPFSVHGSGSSSSSNKPARDAQLKAMREYLACQNNMVYYGKIASGYVTGPLYTMSNRMSIEAWISQLERFHDMYVLLRTYFFRKAGVATALRSWDNLNQDVEHDPWGPLSLVYTERERSRVMLYQAEPDMLNYSGSRKLWSFDVDDAVSAAALRRDSDTLLQGDALFVQYSSLNFGDILISVLDQKGKLNLSNISRLYDVKEGVAQTKTVGDRLTRLYSLLDRRDPHKPVNHDRVKREVNRMLEFLYDVLIQPITDHLQKMKPEQKLIISTNEDLTKVPFAALRDRRTGEFLIQRHTIAYTSSLRALKVCSERLHELQSSPAKIGLGSVVALGNPSYDVCQNCTSLSPLEGTGKEVEHILNLFGETVVVKLLREKATAEQLRHWTARPSSENIRQALVHIGSHAKASDYSTDPNQNVLHLACPYALFNDHDPTTVSTQRHSSSEQGREHLEQEADEYNDEEVSNSDEEFEAMWDEGRGEEVTDLEEKLAATMRKLDLDIPYYNTRQSCDGSTSNLVSDQDFTGTSRSGGEFSTANDKPHDLKAEDIRSSDPRWKAELVVLSACSTSKGRMTAVEGVLSLARAFFIAGVPCTVASLWKVDDNATADLMAMFYEELSKGNDVASALRWAMLRGLSKYEVKDWAPFVVSGVPTLRIPYSLQRHA